MLTTIYELYSFISYSLYDEALNQQVAIAINQIKFYLGVLS